MENIAPSHPNIKSSAPDESKNYSKLQLAEQILKRPDTYVGSCEQDSEEMWIFNSSIKLMEKRQVTYPPALFKIFDEIIVNAADNKQRDATMDMLKVTINTATNEISVYNTGKGIPVQIHSTEQVYIPQLIFGELLTSSNYNDSEKRTTGGRNGYGAKLTNLFSTQFEVETVDSVRQLKYRQVWKNNMSDRGKPQITEAKGQKSYTKVTFVPDLAKFGRMKSLLDNDIINLMKRRVYDIAGTCKGGLKVYLDGEKLEVKSFRDYVGMYLPIEGANGQAPPLIHQIMSDRWELAVSISDGHADQVSYVNSISTSRGGTHYSYILDQLTKAIVEHISKKFKTLNVKPQYVKNHLFLFINCLIDNAAFDTQSKTNLTTKRSEFGSKCELDEKFVKSLLKSSIIDNIVQFAQFQSNKELKKNDGKKQSKINVPKLEDANDAGGKNSADCTLILTEGDSAKALAVSGLSIIGRDRYGVFPLKGKLLNVREANTKQIQDNAEVSSLKKILGLKQGVKYSSARDLRYGHVMIMTDQDHDGSHIKGLLINLFATFWPELLQLPGFLQEFITPIVKVKKGSLVAEKAIKFYTVPQFEQWKVNNNCAAGWTIKYYKGLGTSTSQEAKEYFSALNSHQLNFVYSGPNCDKSIELAFGKAKVEQRKDWLAEYKQGTFLDQSQGKLSYTDFVNKELILFSVASNQRAIPCLVDGLKPGQRKILYVCFKRNLTKEIKVAQLAGSVAEKSAYHHGEVSLTSTIVGMAQNFVGSNNINLLFPSGQFGTRLQGGKDAASARYIFTYLNPIARALFPAADDPLLNYLTDDGQGVEPDYYVPILPTVLINGSAGIGTGWSSNIPNYNPRDIVENIKRLLDKQELRPLHPWYRGYTGCITDAGQSRYTMTGRIERISATSIKISELPVQVWTSEFKDFLQLLLEAGEIKEIREYHTDTTVSFIINFTEEQMSKAEQAGLYKKFKLISSIATSNMVLFDAQGQLRRYSNVGEILTEFFQLRLDYYHRRKASQAQKLTEQCTILNNKVKFILAVRSKAFDINAEDSLLLQQLTKNNYTPFPRQKKARVAGEDEEQENAADFAEENEETGSGKGPKLSDFYYLLSMPISSIGHKLATKLQAESSEKQRELNKLLATAPEDMWRADLDFFLLALQQHEELDSILQSKEIKLLAGKNGPKAGPKAKFSADNVPSGVFIDPPAVNYADPKQKREKKEKPDKSIAELGPEIAERSIKLAGKGSSAPAKKKINKKARDSSEDESSEDDLEVSEEDSDAEMFAEIQPREARAPRRAAVEKKISYADKSGEGEEEDEPSEEESAAEEQEEEDSFIAEESEEDFDPESDFSPVKKPRKKATAVPVAAAAVPAAAKAKAAEKIEPKVVAKKETKPKKMAAAPATSLKTEKAEKKALERAAEKESAPIRPIFASVEEEEGNFLSLADRLALRMNSMALNSTAPSAAAARKSTAVQAKPKINKKAEKASLLASPVSPQQAKKRKTAKKKISDSEEENFMEERKESPVAKPKKAAAQVPAAAAHSVNAARPQRARTAVKYVQESEEEEEVSEFDEAEDEDEDDD
jgi:DNA topoisomerase-2